MLVKPGYRLILLLVCLLVSGGLVAQKPTSLDKSCSSEGCHDGFFDVEYGHGPVLIGECHDCHEPLDVKKHTFEFVRKGKELCEFCHKDQRAGKNVHAPLNDGDCLQCHDPHGSNHFRLLVKEYPPRFYAPFAKENYALCFDCHAESLVLTAKTNGLTDFRNGDLNLHFLHVNKPRRGRTCRACHITHAGNLPKLIRKSVPYGTWDLPVGFTKTETGGNCKSGCHLPKAYDRKKPVNNPTTLSENKL